MLKQVIIVWVAVAAAIGLTAALVPSVEVSGGALGLLGVALLFGLVNALVGPLLRMVSMPLNVVTVGLFALVVNAVLFALTAGLTDALDVGGVLATIVAAAVMSVISALLLIAAAAFVDPQPEATEAT